MTEVKEWVFLGDCWGGCMHIEDCENNGAPTIFYRIKHTLCSRIQHTLKIELLLTVLSNFEKEEALKDSAF